MVVSLELLRVCGRLRITERAAGGIGGLNEKPEARSPLTIELSIKPSYIMMLMLSESDTMPYQDGLATSRRVNGEQGGSELKSLF